MKVTRDVIYDLLPAYFAGEVSTDTKALIDEFFVTDPEFGRMAARFHKLHQDTTVEPVVSSDVDRERDTFDRARHRFKRQRDALMWAAGAAVAFMMVALMPGPDGPRPEHPGLMIGVIFSWLAASAWWSSRSGGGPTAFGAGHRSGRRSRGEARHEKGEPLP